MTSSVKTILIIDDEQVNITLLDLALQHDYHLLTALSASAALEHLEDTSVDLILLDIMMPQMNGYELCKIIKANPKTADIPIIFSTAKNEVGDEAKGLELGAVDYLTKPIQKSILLARIKTHLSLRDALQTVVKQNSLLMHERETVENIILRMRTTENFHSEGIRQVIRPLESTNGDIFLSTLSPDGKTQYMLMGDFTGHGLPAAVAGPLISYIFYEAAAYGETLEHIIHRINRALWEKLPAGVFMACAFIAYRREARELKVYNFGFPELFYFRDNKLLFRIYSKETMLGVLELISVSTAYETTSITSGDTIYSFSDGLFETTSDSGESYGLQRLEALLSSIQNNNQPLEGVIGELTVYAGKNGFTDDHFLMELSL